MTMHRFHPCHGFKNRMLAIASLIAVLSLIAGFPPAQAQKPGAPSPSRPSKPPELEPVPFTAESLGLKVNFPLDSIVVAEKSPEGLILTVTDNQNTPTWTMRIQQMRPSLAQPTPAGLVDDLLRDYRAKKQSYKIIGNDPVSVSSIPSQLCFLELTNKDGKQYVSGWLVVPNGKSTFMVFAVQTLPEYMSRLRPVFDASFATIELHSAEEVASSENARWEAGRHFLQTLTIDKLKTLIGQSQWHRIYLPADAASGRPETERGYAWVEVLEAKKGALNPNRPEKDYRDSEREPGLLVRVKGRVIADADRGIFHDSVALYWMAWDKSSETWSVTATRRQGEAEQNENESGIREPKSIGAPSPSLKVIKRADAAEPVNYEWTVPDPYLSQALGWLVGRLLPREADQPQDYSYYTYVPSYLKPSMYQRLDHWAPASDGSGNWVLTTQFTSDGQPMTSVYGADGSLVRRTYVDGSVTEPISYEELRRLWKNKGLLVGKTGK